VARSRSVNPESRRVSTNEVSNEKDIDEQADVDSGFRDTFRKLTGPLEIWEIPKEQRRIEWSFEAVSQASRSDNGSDRLPGAYPPSSSVRFRGRVRHRLKIQFRVIECLCTALAILSPVVLTHDMAFHGRFYAKTNQELMQYLKREYRATLCNVASYYPISLSPAL